MTVAGKHIFLNPRVKGVQPICTLDAATASTRKERSDVLLVRAEEHPLENGIEYWFPRWSASWDRVVTYIEEERECCPFLAFEAMEERNGIRLIIFQPYGEDGSSAGNFD